MTENKDDLISREALKKKFDEYIKANPNISGIFELGKVIIDNAPTVEVPENEVNCVLTMFGKCSYNKTGCSDCEIKDKIRKALNERLQGEWVPTTSGGMCPFCGQVSPNGFTQCRYCGALMKGGAE